MGLRKTRDEKLVKLLGEDAQYVPLATEIGKRVTAEVKRADDTQVSAAYAEALREAEQEERRRQMAALFGRLSPERRFSTLMGYFSDDDELRGAIAIHRDAIVKREGHETVVGELAEQGKREHRVDLAQIPADMTVELELYHASPDKTRRPYNIHDRFTRDYDDFSRALKLSSVGDSSFMVITEDVTSRGSAVLKAPQPSLERYQDIQLGSMENLSEGTDFSHFLYYGFPIVAISQGVPQEFSHEFEDEVRPTREDIGPLVLGSLSLNGTPLLGNFLE